MARSRAALTGYQLGALIGRGGMGEVVMAHDERIGRDIAIKRMRGSTPTEDAIARFLREARIQARLEHPAIVPVHELGRDADGQPFFTMKRLAGVTLAEMLIAPTPPPRQKLLRALADVCGAIAFAHERGVVHRDLKPANIMLGKFGEVYVLDWGLARVVAEREPRSVATDVASLDGTTQVGAVLGTPGYMAPEQVLGAADVGCPADVYALGAILFEILAGEPLHPRGLGALASTLTAIDGNPSQRAVDRSVPPELDALCCAALVIDPSARPSASELAARLEGYLDGDRDKEGRRVLAASWLAKARAALDSDAVALRAEAMQAAGRALALDPESRDAAELVTRLMLEPSKRLPAALTVELEAAEATVQRRQSRVAMLSFVAIGGFLVMASLNGLRSARTLIVIAALAGVMAAAAFRLSQRRALVSEMMMVVIGNATLAALLSRAFGPLIIVPAVTCVMALSLTSYPQLIDRAKLVIAILAVSWVVPIVLESAGVLESTWRVAGGDVVSTSTLVTIGRSTAGLLIGANLLTIVVFGLFANALARSRRDAQRQVQIQAWHLRQLLPNA
ncbi:MAG: serine/threonine-protein kinase [Deltaproteobacteria bacterium]